MYSSIMQKLLRENDTYVHLYHEKTPSYIFASIIIIRNVVDDTLSYTGPLNCNVNTADLTVTTGSEV